MKIAFLATGDELIFGEIVNSNTARMAARLTELGYYPGEQRVVADVQEQITRSMNELASDHSLVIVIGGLGPTSDDRTRFAAADWAKRPLEFSEAQWIEIQARFNKLGITPHESNRLQAQFPTLSTIFSNPNGSAPGCWIPAPLGSNLGDVALLPGPPRECLPMFENHVLPRLKEKKWATGPKIERWRLLGIPEANIAALFDEALSQSGLETGFRAHYPFVDVKVKVPADQSLAPEHFSKITKIIEPYFVTRQEKLASELLRAYLADHPTQIQLEDTATRGWLLSQINTPSTHACFDSTPGIQSSIRIQLSGMDAFWSGQSLGYSPLKIQINDSVIQTQAPVRGLDARIYAGEWACVQLLKFLGAL